MRESQAAGNICVGCIPGERNLADLLKKTTMDGNASHSIVKLSFTIRQPSGRMIITMTVDLVELRFPLSWTSLKEVWCLPHYDELALKVGQ